MATNEIFKKTLLLCAGFMHYSKSQRDLVGLDWIGLDCVSKSGKCCGCKIRSILWEMGYKSAR